MEVREKNRNILCAWVLIVAFLNLHVPVVALAAQDAPAAKQDSITKNPPEMVASLEAPIPAGAKAEAKKSYTWLWWVLGAVVVGAVAAGGGGGGGGGSNPGGTGGLNVGW